MGIMLVKNLVLFAIGVSECQTVQPELTTVYDGLFEIDFEGAESAEDKANADRDRRLEAERAALIEREAAESSNEDGRSRMGGFRGGPFRGFGSNNQFSSRGPFGPGDDSAVLGQVHHLVPGSNQNRLNRKKMTNHPQHLNQPLLPKLNQLQHPTVY